MVASFPLSTNAQILAIYSAVVEDANSKPTILSYVLVLEVRLGTVLVRTLAVALMLADYKIGLAFLTLGVGVSIDFVGRVVKHGSKDNDKF